MLNLYHLFFNETIFLDSTEIFSIRHCDRETLSTAGCILLVLSRGDILIWRPKPQQLPDRNTAVGSRIRSSWVNVYAIWDTLTSGQRYPPPGGSVSATWTSFNTLISFTMKLCSSEIFNVCPRLDYWMESHVEIVLSEKRIYIYIYILIVVGWF